MSLYTGTAVNELNCSIDTENGKLKPELCKGRYGLIKFYSPECPHCSEMKSDMVLLAKELRRYNFDVHAVNTILPENIEIQRTMAIIDYIPFFCMYDPTGRIFSIESHVAGNRSIPNLVSIICKVTSGETKISNSKKKSSSVPNNCSLNCSYDDAKGVTCTTVGQCYRKSQKKRTSVKAGGARKSQKK
jgi:thiol-disulfide isomerase/thioredoxin